MNTSSTNYWQLIGFERRFLKVMLFKQNHTISYFFLAEACWQGSTHLSESHGNRGTEVPLIYFSNIQNFVEVDQWANIVINFTVK